MASLESDVEICCNPHKRHKQPIIKNLRKISAADVQENCKLTLGSYWCDNCRKYKVADNEQELTEAHGSRHDERERGKAKAILQGLDCSSIRIPKGRETPSVPISPSPSHEIDACCNPFGIHRKQIHKNLRKIKETDIKRHPNLTAGQFWCDNCRNKEPDSELATLFKEIADELAATTSEPNSEELGGNVVSGGSSDSLSLSPATQNEAANVSLKSLGLSPLIIGKHRTKGGKITAAKRKVEDATVVVRKKLCRAAGIHLDDLETDESRKAKHFDNLMNEIKQKIPGSSKLRTYQLLSIIPNSMPIREASAFFGVSRTLMLRARELKEEMGLLPIPDFTRKSRVGESTRFLIVDYYCNDDNSKILPGQRDCVSVAKGVHKQKRLLLNALPELYQTFKKDNEGLKVGLSTFSSLKPKWCVPAGSAGAHEQCICKTHQNFKLMLFALNIKKHYRSLIELCVCDMNDRSCMLRLCEKCPSSREVQKILRKEIKMPELPESELFSSDDEDDYFEANVKFRQWRSTDRTEMVVQVSSRSELLELAASQMSDLIPHDYIARSQKDYIKRMKEELPLHKAVVAMDFSMNYNCLIQGAVQSYHWSPKQATVYPTVIYYKESENVVKHRSIVFISNDLDHDVPLVKKFQERTVAFIKENFPHINEIEYVTDGCSSQYKSKGYFQNLCRHKQEFGMKASHSYYATSHGKSQCDADGGVVKRKARNASIRRPFDNQIINADDLYKFCVEELSDKFHFQYVLKSEVDPERKVHQERMGSLDTVPGTRSFHHIKPLADDTAAFWRLSNDQSEPPSLVHPLLKKARQNSAVTVSPGTYVVARVAKDRYLALITDVYEEEAEADLTLLMPKLPAKEFRWPEEMKTANVPLPHILCIVNPSELRDRVLFSDSDLSKLYNLRILRKQI